MPFPLELNAWLNASGDAADSWLHAGRDPARIFTLDHYVEAARVAHRGVFSNIFTSDRPQLVLDGSSRPEHTLDPLVLFASVLAQVPDIGAIVTASTTYQEPYTLARQVQSLNLLTGGRISWNAVTSWNPAIAANYDAGQDLPSRAERYARAEEFISIVLQLWQSWSFPWQNPAALPGVARSIDHRGHHFRIAGPLNVPNAPGGRPRILQAGGSPQGIALAARYADAVYAPASSLQASRAFRLKLHRAARSLGRSEPNLPRLLPVLTPVLCASDAEARARQHELDASLQPTNDELTQLAELIGVRRRQTGDDRPLTADDFGDISASIVPIGAIEAKRGLALSQHLSLRQLAVADRQPGLIGTPAAVAAHMLQGWREEAVDGFTIVPRYLPDDLALFVDEVVPLLQQAGASPTHYPRALKVS